MTATIVTSHGRRARRQLEKGLKALQANLGTLGQNVEQYKRDAKANLDKEITALNAGVQNVGKKLEESMIADSPLEVAGIAYVCLGLVMAHLAEEVADFLPHLGLN